MQVIARIHTNSLPVRRLIQDLLIRIGKHHPQALMYPLLVASKSQSLSRRAEAQAVMNNVAQTYPTLVEQVRGPIQTLAETTGALTGFECGSELKELLCQYLSDSILTFLSFCSPQE